MLEEKRKAGKQVHENQATPVPPPPNSNAVPAEKAHAAIPSMTPERSPSREGDKVIDGTIEREMNLAKIYRTGWAGQPYEKGRHASAEVVLPEVSSNGDIVSKPEYKQALALITGYLEGLLKDPTRIRHTAFKTLTGAAQDAFNRSQGVNSCANLDPGQLEALGFMYQGAYVKIVDIHSTSFFHPYKALGAALVKLGGVMAESSAK